MASRDEHAKHIADGVMHDKDKYVSLDDVELASGWYILPTFNELAARVEKIEEAVRALYLLAGRKPPV
jgi:hypothetical protein